MTKIAWRLIYELISNKSSATTTWIVFEALRAELGYADYLGALQRYRLGAMNDPRLLQMSFFWWTIRLPTGCTQARSTQ